MFVDSVSFGKTILVKAPVQVAYKIATMANIKSETECGKQVNKFIDDTHKGKAYAYPSEYLPDKSYIFSGEEGNKYWKSLCKAWDKTEYARDFYRNDAKTARIETAIAWEMHRANVNALIKSSEKVLEMNVIYDKSGKIKAVNINA